MIRTDLDDPKAGRLKLLRLTLPLIAEVQQAQQAKETEDRVKRELAEAQQAAAQQRSDAESQGK
jgi:hypothetical protein